MFGLTSTTILVIAPVLIAAWLFQAYWGIRTFFDAEDDIQRGSKVSEWLYARFVNPIVIGVMLICWPVESFVESVMKGVGASWGFFVIIGTLLLLWPSILIVIVIRTYELMKIQTSKTA